MPGGADPPQTLVGEARRGPRCPGTVSGVTGALALPQGDEAAAGLQAGQGAGQDGLQAILKVIPKLCNIMFILFISMLGSSWETPTWAGSISLGQCLGQQDPVLAMAARGPWGQQAQSQQ